MGAQFVSCCPPHRPRLNGRPDRLLTTDARRRRRYGERPSIVVDISSVRAFSCWWLHGTCSLQAVSFSYLSLPFLSCFVACARLRDTHPKVSKLFHSSEKEDLAISVGIDTVDFTFALEPSTSSPLHDLNHSVYVEQPNIKSMRTSQPATTLHAPGQLQPVDQTRYRLL